MMKLSKVLVNYCIDTPLVEVDGSNAELFLKKHGIPNFDLDIEAIRRSKQARRRIILSLLIGMVVGVSIAALIGVYCIGSFLILVLTAIGATYLGAMTVGLLMELKPAPPKTD